MKLTKIKKLCLEAKRFVIVDGLRCQWIGNGKHFFRVYGARFDLDGLEKLLDVKEKKAAECDFDEWNERDAPEWQGIFDATEVQAFPVADVWGYDQKLLALNVEGRVCYLRYDALDCLEQDVRRTYTLRRVNDMTRIVCSRGVIAEAIFTPIADEDAQRLNEALLKVAEAPAFSIQAQEAAPVTFKEVRA